MKTKLIFGLLIISLLIAGCGDRMPGDPSEARATATPEQIEQLYEESKENDTIDEITTNAVVETVSKCKEGFYYVERVIDGDTFEIEGGEKVRMICIDTPEEGQDYYDLAKKRLTQLIENQCVKLEKDISEKDRYGRLLRYVYFNGDLINRKLVREGLAKSYRYEPDVRLCRVIEQAEEDAQSAKANIWRGYNPEDDNSNIECGYNKYNCDDFSSQSEAQAVLKACGTDIHQLDGDDDGIACETLP